MKRFFDEISLNSFNYSNYFLYLCKNYSCEKDKVFSFEFLDFDKHNDMDI